MPASSPLAPAVSQPPVRPAHRAHHDRGLAAIAVFKMVKATLLILAWLGTREILRKDVADQARQWLQALSFTTGPRYVRELLAWASGVSDARLRELGLVALLYATLYTVEGVGLWLERRWAEYLTIIMTGSLIPFEIYEIARGLSTPKFIAFVVNIAVVAYLAYLLRRARGTTPGVGA